MKHTLLKSWKAIIEIIIGTILTAAAFGLVIIPKGFAAAGVTGFAKVLTGMIPVSLSAMVFLINASLLLLGLIFVGKEFVTKTVGVSIMFPVVLELFLQCQVNCENVNTVICIVIGGVMLGSGAGLILRSGASSGGFDIFAVILNRRLGLPIANVLNLCDAAVILTQFFMETPFNVICGIIVVTISARIAGMAVSLKLYRQRSKPAVSI
ncbi:MAG: YitT family protein [Emergencia sp.]